MKSRGLHKFLLAMYSLCSYEGLCECINQFLIHLCFHLENYNKQFASYVRDILQAALPQIDSKQYTPPSNNIDLHIKLIRISHCGKYVILVQQLYNVM